MAQPGVSDGNSSKTGYSDITDSVPTIPQMLAAYPSEVLVGGLT